jgi:flagellar biosynthesis/type III secretory pathway protein FliH
MAQMAIKLDKPLKAVGIVNNYSGGSTAADFRQTEELKAQKNLYGNACRTVQGLADKLNQFYERIFVEHSEEIARLSVEIARKILMRKVEDGDYKIEEIIKEILKNAPAHQDLVVRLNPKDLEDCQKIQQQGGVDELSGVRLVADAGIGRAECVLESPKGIIKSLIDENLEQIAKALNKKTE